MDEKRWWHPIKGDDKDELNWLCDHVGEANEVMNVMWKLLCKSNPDLPLNGWEPED